MVTIPSHHHQLVRRLRGSKFDSFYGDDEDGVAAGDFTEGGEDDFDGEEVDDDLAPVEDGTSKPFCYP